MRWRTASAECARRRRRTAIDGGEEVFQFEDAARRRHVFVGGDARDRRFVHADRVGDGLEIQRPQMLHAMREEGVLLPHDLGRDLEDRSWRAGRARGSARWRSAGNRRDSFSRLSLRAVFETCGVIGLVDQNPRQRVGVEFDLPAAVRAGAHEHIGHDRLHQRRAEGEAGLRIERRISAIMSARSSSSTPQSRRSAARSRFASSSRLATSACIAGSKRSRSLSWIARHSARLRAQMPAGSKVCSIASTLSTSAAAAPSFSATVARSPVR